MAAQDDPAAVPRTGGRPPYCSPADVLRKFDPTLTEEQLDTEALFAADDREMVLSRIEGVGAMLENRTGHAWRETRVGVRGRPETYEVADASFRRYQRGIRIWFNHREVCPLDPARDTLEIRAGYKDWRPVLDEQGIDPTANDAFEANYREGWVRLYATYFARYSPARRSGALRLSYRYGALGGDRDAGGQTTVSKALEATDQGATETIEIAEAGRLPAQGVFLIDGREYVSAQLAPAGEEQSLRVQRGIRGTRPVAHPAGATIHYCPLEIREAVAAKTCRELVQYDNMSDLLEAPDDNVTHRDRLDAWEQEWDQCLRHRAEARIL